MPTPAVPSPRVADGIGVGLAAALALWVAFVAGGGEGRPLPVLALLAGMAAAVIFGRLLADVPGRVPGAVAGAVAGAFLLTFPGALGAGGAPTGYANSNATLAGIGALAALGAASAARSRTARRSWLLLSAALVGMALATQSIAGVASLGVATGLLLLAALLRWAPAVIAGGMIAGALAVAVTTGMAIDTSAPFAGSDAVRVELWAAAAELAQEDPLRGLGPGEFEAANPVSDDADLRWVHHEYLELAVELGGGGVVLVVALGLWAAARLHLSTLDIQADPVPAAIAGAALTLVVLHGAVDHVWHSPPLLLLTALLLGAATGPGGIQPKSRFVISERGVRAGRRIAGDAAEG